MEVLTSWLDTKYSESRVLEHLKVDPTSPDLFLSDEVNQRFLEFHRVITEEFGSTDKQHSWAAIEKPAEIFFYGLYFPDQSRHEHSEDAVVRQTQELLETDAAPAGWKIYIFTQNSPCLSRAGEPCMLKLTRKALEWWIRKGVKTHVGYLNCWGFRGFKEDLFKNLNYSHLVSIDRSRDYESYVKEMEKMAHPLCESLFSAVKRVRRPLTFPVINPVQGQARRPHAPLAEDGSVTQGADAPLERGPASAEEEKYAEMIREELKRRFNQSAVRLFSSDVATFRHLQIGKVRFPTRD